MLDRDDTDKDCLSPMEDKVQTIKQVFRHSTIKRNLTLREIQKI